MARYDREDYEDLDEYEEEGEEQEEEGDAEEEYEEEEAPQPTQEELEYLELRKRLKENIRKKMKKESGSSHGNTQDEKKKLAYVNFGSFFGPSHPAIAPRVIQESRSLLENQHLAAKVSKPHHDTEKSSSQAAAGFKTQAYNHSPTESELKVKVQNLKQTRDYSFLLSDDAELPTPQKDPPHRHVSVPNPEVRSAQVAPMGKQSLNKNARQVPNGREERKPVSTGGLMHPKAGSHKLTSASRPILTSVESRKQLGNSNGRGPGWPLGAKYLPSKKPEAAPERRSTAGVAKSSSLSVQRPPSLKLHSSASKQPSTLKNNADQRKEVHEYRKEKVFSKPQINKPPAKISSRPPLREDHPKKKAVRQYSDEEDESGSAISMIRNMFGYNPNKYAGCDDDDSDMEANFDDILMEEKRSARIARQEDEEELRKIEEEERRERSRQEARKRKLSQR